MVNSGITPYTNNFDQNADLTKRSLRCTVTLLKRIHFKALRPPPKLSTALMNNTNSRIFESGTPLNIFRRGHTVNLLNLVLFFFPA